MQGGTMGIPRLEIRAEGSGRDVVRGKKRTRWQGWDRNWKIGLKGVLLC